MSLRFLTGGRGLEDGETVVLLDVSSHNLYNVDTASLYREVMDKYSVRYYTQSAYLESMPASAMTHTASVRVLIPADSLDRLSNQPAHVHIHIIITDY